MPFGLLNEHHEPTNYYGVQRNFVETLIIPSTWREGGFGVHGNTEIGLDWDAGLTTGLNIGGWETIPRTRSTARRSISRTTASAPAGDASGAVARQRPSPLAIPVAQLQRHSGLAGRRGGIHRTGGGADRAPGTAQSSESLFGKGTLAGLPGAADCRPCMRAAASRTPRLYNLANAGASNPLPVRVPRLLPAGRLYRMAAPAPAHALRPLGALRHGRLL